MTPDMFDDDIYYVEISNKEMDDIKNQARLQGALITFAGIFVIWLFISYIVN